MALTIALAGNPNSGKTTLFNAPTGANQFVGNWPGVTVEKKEGKLKTDKQNASISARYTGTGCPKINLPGRQNRRRRQRHAERGE